MKFTGFVSALLGKVCPSVSEDMLLIRTTVSHKAIKQEHRIVKPFLQLPFSFD